MRTKFKPWAEPYIKEHPEVAFTLEQLSEFRNSFNLEIGSGKGKFLLGMANKFQDQFFIGVERNVTCCGYISKKLVENEINNAKLMFDNADAILDVLKDKSVDNIYLNFSDPWPKKRHHKRRLTAPSYLAKYARVLKNDGKVIMKTDNDDLFAFTLEMVEASEFKIIYQTFDYKDFDEENDIMTEYEQNFRELGQPIHRLIMVKKND